MEKRKLHIFPANKKEEGPTRAKKNFTPRKNTPKKANKGMKDEQEESDSEDKGTEKTDEKEDASSGEGEDKEGMSLQARCGCVKGRRRGGCELCLCRSLQKGTEITFSFTWETMQVLSY